MPHRGIVRLLQSPGLTVCRTRESNHCLLPMESAQFMSTGACIFSIACQSTLLSNSGSMISCSGLLFSHQTMTCPSLSQNDRVLPTSKNFYGALMNVDRAMDHGIAFSTEQQPRSTEICFAKRCLHLYISVQPHKFHFR